MNAVLKADMEDGRPAVQPFSERATRTSLAEESKPAPAPEDPELLALKAENKRLSEALQTLRTETEEAISAAREEGRSQALAEFQRDETASLDLLGRHLEDACSTIRSRVESWEAVSLAIAQTALSKVVYAPERYEEILAGMIRHLVDQVRRDSLLQVRVSPADFPDASAVEALGAEIEGGDLKIIRDDAVNRGGCVLSLRIGEVESSLDYQWNRLVTLFEALAETDLK